MLEFLKMHKNIIIKSYTCQMQITAIINNQNCHICRDILIYRTANFLIIKVFILKECCSGPNQEVIPGDLPYIN